MLIVARLYGELQGEPAVRVVDTRCNHGLHCTATHPWTFGSIMVVFSAPSYCLLCERDLIDIVPKVEIVERYTGPDGGAQAGGRVHRHCHARLCCMLFCDCDVM